MQRLATTRVAAASPHAGPGEVLDGLPEAARRALLGIVVRRSWGAGRTILWEGEVARSAFVVERGRVRMRTIDSEGEERILGWLPSGAIGAIASVIAGVGFPCDLVTDGPCELLHLERGRLLGLLERDPTTSLAIACLLGRRVAMLMNQRLVRTFSPLSERVWAMLQQLVRANMRAGSTTMKQIPITQADLARAVGASRYRVGVELRRLRAARRIALERGVIRVLD